MSLTLSEMDNYNGIQAFRPVIKRPEMDVTEIATRDCMEIAWLPAAERTESKLADRLADVARLMPKDQQNMYLEQACYLLEKCDLVKPEPMASQLSAEFLVQSKLLKDLWKKSIMQNSITRMMFLGWSWANAVEAEDDMYPERKAEREAKAAAAVDAELRAAAEAAFAAESAAADAKMQQERANRLIKDNRNPSLRPGNLYLGVTERDMRAVFEPFGRLTRVNVPKCRETGNTRGFAFVDFASPQDAAKAYIALNDAPRMVGNQKMRVEFASTELRATAGAAPRRK